MYLPPAKRIYEHDLDTDGKLHHTGGEGLSCLL
jgi:hypothetical protein